MWTLYDEIIDKIPENLMITDYSVGLAWTYVQCGTRTGVALTVRTSGKNNQKEDVIGKPLREVAEYIKSWNFLDASLGAAAINCYYNTVEKVDAMHGFAGQDLSDESWKERTKKDAFIAFSEEVQGKKVACIGHFPDIEKKLGPICELSILERNPGKDDYPDSACEYILPEQDYVFVTGMTFTNKTLPRLLQIMKGKAKVSIVGPSIPIAPVLADYGVNNISGFCVTDPEIIKERIRRGGKTDIFSGGRMISADL